MDRTSRRNPDQGGLSFLAGGGEMSERIRGFDWSRTPLGSPEVWPQSLRTAVSILLPSKARIVLLATLPAEQELG